MSIKKLNNANPAAKRPLRVEDLQDIWSGLSSAFAQYGTPRIISGMLLSSNGYLTAGCIARQGELYFYDGGDNIQEGSNLYVARVPDDDDMRTLSDGTVQPFSYLNIVTSDSAIAGASYIGQATRATLDAWRVPIIPDGAISSDMLAENSVLSSKLETGIQPVVNTNYTFSPSVPNQNIFSILRNSDGSWIAPIFDIGLDGYTRTLSCKNTSSPAAYTTRPDSFDIPVRFQGAGVLVVAYDTPFGVGRRVTITSNGQNAECIVHLARYDATKGYTVTSVTNFDSIALSVVDALA